MQKKWALRAAPAAPTRVLYYLVQSAHSRKLVNGGEPVNQVACLGPRPAQHAAHAQGAVRRVRQDGHADAGGAARGATWYGVQFCWCTHCRAVTGTLATSRELPRHTAGTAMLVRAHEPTMARDAAAVDGCLAAADARGCRGCDSVAMSLRPAVSPGATHILRVCTYDDSKGSGECFRERERLRERPSPRSW